LTQATALHASLKLLSSLTRKHVRPVTNADSLRNRPHSFIHSALRKKVKDACP